MIGNKTVYFLGAGASAASEFALPTMNEFFTEFKIRKYPSLSRFIIKYFFSSLATRDISELKKEEINQLESKIRHSKLNLEEVFSLLDFYLSRMGKFGKEPPSWFIDARRQLKAYVSSRLNIFRDEIKSLNQNKLWSDKYKPVLEKVSLSPRDTIITLNYDTIIECTLNKIWSEMKFDKKKEIFGNSVNHINYNKHHPLCDKLSSTILGVQTLLSGAEEPYYSLREMKTGVFLKLHGSLDWIYCPNKSCRNHYNIFRFSSPQELAAQFATFRSCNICGEVLEPVIVPPTMYKAYERIPKLGFIWSIAHRELTKASKIVVIGVSFAESDFYLRGLFKSVITESIVYYNGKPKFPVIEVVDKNKEVCKEVCKKIREITGAEAEPIGNLDDYLRNLRGLL